MRINVSDEYRARLDAVVADMNAHAPEGFTTTRDALVARLLREGLERREVEINDPNRFVCTASTSYERAPSPAGSPTPRLRAVRND